MFFLYICNTTYSQSVSAETKYTQITEQLLSTSDAAKREFKSSTVYSLWEEYQENPDALSKFYSTLAEAHIIEPHPTNASQSRVVYFAKGDQYTDYIMQSGGPDFYGLRFSQIGDSDYYYCVQNIPNDALFNYGFNRFSREKVSDESGLYLSSMEHIYDGTVVGPSAKLSPYINRANEAPKGELVSFNLFSKSMNEKREFVVYLPANYDSTVRHNLIVQLDGQNFSRRAQNSESWKAWTPLPTILDNLHNEDKLSPTVAVFVFNQGNRSGDLLDNNFHKFIALELVSWIKERYSISESSKNRIISGPSRAGFASAYTAFQYPNVFGGVLTQSGSFYYTLNDNTNWPIYPEFESALLNKFKQSETLSFSWYIDVGLYDLGLAAVGTNRQLRDILELKGYSVEYSEYKGGHSHLNWRHNIHLGIIELLGK